MALLALHQIEAIIGVAEDYASAEEKRLKKLAAQIKNASAGATVLPRAKRGAAGTKVKIETIRASAKAAKTSSDSDEGQRDAIGSGG